MGEWSPGRLATSRSRSTSGGWLALSRSLGGVRSRPPPTRSYPRRSGWTTSPAGARRSAQQGSVPINKAVAPAAPILRVRPTSWSDGHRSHSGPARPAPPPPAHRRHPETVADNSYPPAAAGRNSGDCSIRPRHRASATHSDPARSRAHPERTPAPLEPDFEPEAAFIHRPDPVEVPVPHECAKVGFYRLLARRCPPADAARSSSAPVVGAGGTRSH